MSENPLDSDPLVLPKSSLLDQKLTFDQVVQKLGINFYNIRIYFFMALFFMADGSELVVLSLLINKFSDVWSLNTFQKGMFGSSIFIGCALGSLCSGLISDRKGRRPAYLIGSTLVLVFAACSSLAQNAFAFILLRIICGFGIGLSVPALFALATELTPSAYRSAVLNFVWVFFPIGATFVILLTKWFIEIDGGWRYIMLFASFPCLIVLLFSYKVPESPRFLMSNGFYKQGLENLEEIIKYVGAEEKIKITEQDKENLIAEAEEYKLNQEKADFGMLFTPEYRKVTFLICSIYFISSLNYYGATYILPQIFEEEADSAEGNVGDVYLSLIFTYFVEVPCCFLSAYLANNKYLLRVRTMMLGLSVNALSVVLLIIFPGSVPFSAALFKCSINISFCVIEIYACEVYPTKIRSMGVGLGNSCTRVAAILTPFFSQLLFDCYKPLPFVLYFFGSIGGLFCCLNLPFETYNLGLK